MSDAELQRQLGEMQAALLREIGTVRHVNSAALQALATEVGKLEVRIAGMESSVTEQIELKARVSALETENATLRTEWATFKGEKGERDRNSDARSKLWMSVAGGLIVALVLTALGAGLTMWKQSEQNAALQQQMFEMLQREQSRPTP